MRDCVVGTLAAKAVAAAATREQADLEEFPAAAATERATSVAVAREEAKPEKAARRAEASSVDSRAVAFAEAAEQEESKAGVSTVGFGAEWMAVG